MSCEEFRKTLSDAALEPLSPAQDSHLSGCESCTAALAAERALLERIDVEMQDGLEIEPSLAFLPSVRRRVTEGRARRAPGPHWWLAPALATLAGLLAASHLARETRPGPEAAAVAPARSALAGGAPSRAEPMEPDARRAPESPEIVSSAPRRLARTGPAPSAPARAPMPTTAPNGPGASVPRVFVPPEDELVVRRLARRLQGRAARAIALAPEPEAPAAGIGRPFDFALKPVAGEPEMVSLDDRLLRGAEPALDEPPSFDRTVEKTGRDT